MLETRLVGWTDSSASLQLVGHLEEDENERQRTVTYIMSTYMNNQL